MKYLKLLVLLLVSFSGFAQAPSNYTNINGRYRWIAGMFDSTFSLPKGTTPSLRTGGSTNPGALFYRTTDSTVKYWTGTQWLTVADTTRFVPYVGATKNVNLGQYGMTTKWLQFDTSSQAVTERRLQWSNDEGTLQFGMTNGSTITQRIGLEQFARVKNVDATQINKGDVVYLFGASGDRAAVKKADNRQDATSSKTLGVATEDIPVDSVGFVGTFGVVGKLDLSAYNPGDILYLDSIPGKMTKTKPQAPYHLVFIGVVERANSGNGLLFTNVQNGYELEELHNVRITSPVLNKSILAYDSVRALWVDTTLGAIGGILGSGTNGYVTKFTSANTVGNSIMQDNGSTINLGGSMIATGDIEALGIRANNYLQFKNINTSSSLTNYTTLQADSTNKTFKFNFGDGVRLATFKYAAGSYTYDLPSSNGTLALTSDITSSISGTTNYIPKFTSSSAIGNSQIFDNGTNVGINNASPTYKLDVTGTGRFTGQVNLDNDLLLTQSAYIYSNAGGSGVRAGFFLDGTNTVVTFLTGATERMRITSAGNVGIGTTSPTNGKLVVKSGESDVTGIVLERGSNTQKLVNIYSETADGKIAIASGATTTILLNSAGSSYLNGGNVGIGTSSPLQTTTNRTVLTVNGTNSAIVNLGIGGSLGSYMYADASGGTYETVGTNSISANGANRIDFSTNGSERMRITSGGEVLINTTSDAGDYKLQVNGKVYSSGALTTITSGGDILNFGRTDQSTIQLYQDGTNYGYYNTVTAVSDLIINNTTGAATFYSSIKTGAPSGGTAKPFKIGEVATVSPTSPNRTIRVEIDGTVYYIAAKTTND